MILGVAVGYYDSMHSVAGRPAKRNNLCINTVYVCRDRTASANTDDYTSDEYY